MTHQRIFLLATLAFWMGFTSLNTVAQTQPIKRPFPAPTTPTPTPPTRPQLVPTPTAPSPTANSVKKKIEERLYSFRFVGADLDTVMETYCQWTGKIYLKNDNVKATVTLKADNLTKSECIQAVEAILGMNNIALVPMGEKFIKVVQSTAPDLGGQGLAVHMDPDQKYEGSDKLVTQIIQLKNVEIPEVQTAVQHLMHAYGKIQTLARSHSLMITDPEKNILRIRKLLEFLDQASARSEPRIYNIKYADATEIASTLNEIVTAAQGDQKKKTSTVAPNPAVRTPPGVIRARTVKSPTPTQATISRTEGGAAPIIQGTVKVMADERTNILLIFSQKENFEFFDHIIKVLDVEVEPAVTFEVVNLEYADAEELAGTLNDLLGSRGSSRSSSSSSSRNSRTSKSRNSNSRSSRSSSRSSNSRSRSSRVAPKTAAATIQNLSSLSENTKILADKRSNAILLMGEKADIEALKNVIKSLDVMLEQVLIEAAIFEVTLGDDLEHGIQWLYKSQNKDKIGSWDGVGLITNTVGNVASAALTYYQALQGIDTEIAIKLSAGDSNVRLLATPVIMTTDNTEASLSVGEQRPVVTSTDSFANSSGTQRSHYEYKDIGIQLTVTPRINPQRFVVMEINQKADQVGDEIPIDGNNVPVILNREFDASIAVPNRGTIALGGLINTETRDSVSKIPILGDIPFIGRYLFSSVSKKNRRTELIVLMTPYVLTTPEEMLRETERLYDATDMQPSDWPKKGWLGSPLQSREKPEAETETE
jgi:general secretion pathway protein D